MTSTKKWVRLGVGEKETCQLQETPSWGSGKPRTSSITNLGKIHDFTKFNPL
jgi:hypothetical protein